ncbi:hypothetical protein MW290_01185 [Aquincola tertiaricarbonis]|uniref:Uncharacterized protein n=1 Tax=Aquincola tertiaricarbonis TaxID=391953 RepID=A0ABY4S5W2_AQUTE|nr:hypothetical protein [Aquincola tertiaricarbonis]URI07271.1 hypothetical protein MW290_01185 [Aquincola tertiaricarbonis]
MNRTNACGPCWSTAAFAQAADTTPLELGVLAEHLALCHLLRGRLFAMHCAMEAVRDFVAARFVTTLLVVAVVAGIGSLAW